MPIIGSKQQREQSKQINRVLEKMLGVQLIFNYFTNFEWIYESITIDKVLSTMSPEEKRIFPMDIRQINWNQMLIAFIYGLRRYFIKEDIVNPF
jgi:hypothetical protein